MRACILLMAVACASQPGEYQRNPLMRPPPAARRPGVGAPIVGQPGSRPEVPRAPRERVLPPSREPGLWAADTARVSEPVVLNVLIPTPHGDDELARSASTCAVFVNAAMHEIGTEAAALGWPQHVRICMAARLVAMCSEKVVASDEQSRKDAVFVDAQRARRTKRLRDWAQKWRATVCDQGLLASTNDAFAAVEARWNINHPF